MQPEHFDVFGTALLLTLQHELGSNWNLTVRDAWQAAYDDTKEVIKEALMSGREVQEI